MTEFQETVSFGINILGNSIYIIGLEQNEEDLLLNFATILKGGNVIDILNKWLKKNKKKLDNAYITCNLTQSPIMKISEFQENTGVTINEAVDFELGSFLVNEEDFTFAYENIGNKLYIAAVDRDFALDFVNSLSIKPNSIDLTILGLYNICDYLYNSTKPTVAVFYSLDYIVYIAYDKNSIIDYKQCENNYDVVNELKLYIDEILMNPNKIYIAGESEFLKKFENSSFSIPVEEISLVTNIPVDESLKDNNELIQNSSLFSIALGFALKPFNKGQKI